MSNIMSQDNCPTIGVAIMAYKYDMFVAQAIDSVLSQTVTPDQLIIVDDASHDDTGKIADKYGVQFIQREKRLGPRANFHDTLFNLLWPDYCMFLGADNWLHPHYIEKTLDAMLVNNVSIVSTEVYLVGEYASIVANNRSTYFLNGYDVADQRGHNGSSLFNRQHSIDSGGQYPMRHPTTHDVDGWLNMLERGYTGFHITEPLLYYRQHRFNFSQHRWNKLQVPKFIDSLIEKYS
jgi:glycosyltransferase involved in cell wall biosynthesis